MERLTRTEKVRRLDAWARRERLTPRETRILRGFWIDDRDIGASKSELCELLKKLMRALWP